MKMLKGCYGVGSVFYKLFSYTKITTKASKNDNTLARAETKEHRCSV